MLITREMESQFPRFFNHDSARKWFKERYGNQFVLNGSEIIDGVKYYFYHLIEDKQVYTESMDKLKKGEVIDAFAMMNSYQNVEISEEGFVHVVY